MVGSAASRCQFCGNSRNSKGIRMSRPRNPYLTPRCHKGSAVVDLYDAGKRRTVTLGPWGSPRAQQELVRVQAEQIAGARSVQAEGTVSELLLAYLTYAEQHYRGPDGTPRDETHNIKVACRHVRELYGMIPATEFGPLALKAIRQRFIAADWCRKTVNQQIERVRRIFKWAVAEELVPPSIYQALAAVEGLKRGRSSARETEPVGPVSDAVVDATLPHLSHYVRGIIELQRLTGCRPGEACILRRADIDTGGTVWLYKPTHHKNAHRGKSRSISIGPKAQALLKEYFTLDLEEFLFSPRKAVEDVRAERSANRKTPRYPSHMKRNSEKRQAKPARTPDTKYTTRSYSVAVARACDRAFPLPARQAQQKDETHAEWWDRLTEEQRTEVKVWRKEHRWHPNQLRHSFATRVRKEHGLEAAQVLLGHSRADVTQIYAERNEELAGSVAARIG